MAARRDQGAEGSGHGGAGPVVGDFVRGQVQDVVGAGEAAVGGETVADGAIDVAVGAEQASAGEAHGLAGTDGSPGGLERAPQPATADERFHMARDLTLDVLPVCPGAAGEGAW